MSTRELIETALHVLVAWNSGKHPDPAELETLKTEFPFLAHLPADELACQVISDLSGRTFPELASQRKQSPAITPPKKLAG